MNERIKFWLITLATFLAVAATLSLGRWQLSRAAEKERWHAAIEAQAQLPALDGLSLANTSAHEALVHRLIVARGQWLAEKTVFLDNRKMQGQMGFFVLTPMRLEGSQAVVLVQRGWVARNFEDRARLPQVQTPAGMVEVRGRIAPPPSRLYELGEPGSGAIRQNLDLTQFRIETGLPLAEVLIQQLGPVSEGLLRDWPEFNAGVEKNYGYAFQWFGLSALMAILYVWFQIVRRFIARRRA